MRLTLLTLILVTFVLFVTLAMAHETDCTPKIGWIPLGGKKPAGDAVAADVLEGKTFSNKDDVGVTGTMATQSLSANSTTVPAGYYHATTLNGVDSDLATGNIRSGATIFGVAGKTEVVDTTSGDVVAGEILSGKKAWVDGVEVTGTIPTQTLSPANDTVAAGNYAATTLSTVDTDLESGNIKSGTTIFGVAGTYPLAPVARTGQTFCYDATGILISCTGTGQDGELQQGVIPPNPRFTDNADGTVTDNLKGIIWLKNANCFGVRTWASALTDSNSLASGACGLSDGSVAGDWRLPNLKELHSLIDLGINSPALSSGHPFIGVVSNFYWSSSTYTGSTGYAWFVDMNVGILNFLAKPNTNYVWPVRGGQ